MSAAGKFPTLLIITPGVLNAYKASGVTLRRLLSGWPAERIAQIHSDAFPPDPSVCAHYYSTAAAAVRPGMPLLRRRLAQVGAYAMGRAEHGLVTSRLSPQLRAWIDARTPDVILSETGNRSFLNLTRMIVDYADVPLVLRQPDDWVTGWPAAHAPVPLPLLGGWLSSKVNHEYAGLARRAANTVAIGDDMGDEYRRRYGGEWRAFPNPIDPSEWPPPAFLPSERRDPAVFRILYSGSLIPQAQLPGVTDVANAVSELVSAGASVRLDIATHAGTVQAATRLARLPGVRLLPQVPESEFRARLQSYDLLVIPLALNRPQSDYIRLSMPGKIAEYAASGTPVLVYGAPDSAPVRHARAHDWAEVVDARSSALLLSAIRRLSDDPARCDALGARGREMAIRDFDARRLSHEFQELLRQAAFA